MSREEKSLPFWNPDNPEQTIKVQNILLEDEYSATRKVELIQAACHLNLSGWIQQVSDVAIDEQLKKMNSVSDGIDRSSLIQLIEALSTMTMTRAETFFEWCKKFVITKNWQAEYAMNKAKEIVTAEMELTIRENREQREDDNCYHLKRGTQMKQTKEEALSLKPSATTRETKTDYSLKSTASDAYEENDPPASVRKSLTIVLLGSSGSGKTTMVNSIANFCRYPVFTKFMSKGPRVCVALRYTTHDGNKPIVIEPSVTHPSGMKNNEDLSGKGKSATMKTNIHCFDYEFNKEKIDLRVIDTPGMNDTEGDEQDDKNLNNTFEFLEFIGHVNAFCFILPSNEARLTMSFKNCMRKLLSRLPPESYKNIFFCFTHVSQTNYKPGATLDLLREYFKEKDICIKLTPANTYSFDNEPFRYLCEIRKFANEKNDRRTDESRKCYENNVEQLERLVTYASTLERYEFKTEIKRKCPAQKKCKRPGEVENNEEEGVHGGDDYKLENHNQNKRESREDHSSRNIDDKLTRIPSREDRIKNAVLALAKPFQEIITRNYRDISVALEEIDRATKSIEELTRCRKDAENSSCWVCRCCEKKDCIGDFERDTCQGCYHPKDCHSEPPENSTIPIWDNQVKDDEKTINNQKYWKNVCEQDNILILDTCVYFSVYLQNPSFSLAFEEAITQTIDNIISRTIDLHSRKHDSPTSPEQEKSDAEYLIHSLEDFCKEFKLQLADKKDEYAKHMTIDSIIDKFKILRALDLDGDCITKVVQQHYPIFQ